MKAFLSLTNVSKEYETARAALAPISLAISAHERVGIVGETGSGKSTLLRIIAGLIQPDSGSVLFTEEKVQGPDDKLVPGHPNIAYLSQHFELPKFISVFEHLDDPYLIAPKDADLIYSACQITHLLDKDTRSISGGEKQRVALAKLLLRSPKILLLDEPFSNLDFNHKRVIKQVITDVEDNFGTTVILVAHDPMDVLSWAKRILVFKKGELIQEDTPFAIYNQPLNPYVAGLFGLYNLLTPNQWGMGESATPKQVVRPERIAIGKRDSSVSGTIERVRYFGNFEELQIKTMRDIVYLQCPVGKYQVGDQLDLYVIDNYL